MSQQLTTCADCGMPVAANEYHPYAACLMFKACHNSDTVRENLAAVMERAQPAGEAEKTVDELAMLVRLLVHALRKAAPANPLSARAVDYLERHGLQGSVLRATPSPPPNRMHSEGAMGWRGMGR